MCAHEQFKTVAAVKPATEPGTYALKVAVQCVQCGTPMVFEAGYIGALARLEENGLVARLQMRPGGD